MDNNDFHTFSEYMKKEDHFLTASMEDYLEMICRLSMRNGFARIHELSAALNVQPPSATRMVQRLGELNLLQYEKYGVIILTEKGMNLGEALIKRHNIIEALLKLMGVPGDIILAETEKIEHTVSDKTTGCIEDFISFLKYNPDIVIRFNDFLGTNR